MRWDGHLLQPLCAELRSKEYLMLCLLDWRANIEHCHKRTGIRNLQKREIEIKKYFKYFIDTKTISGNGFYFTDI